MWWLKSDIERRVGTIFKTPFFWRRKATFAPGLRNDDIAQLDMVFTMADALAKLSETGVPW